MIRTLQEFQNFQIVSLDIEIAAVELSGRTVLSGTFFHARTQRTHRRNPCISAGLLLAVPGEFIISLPFFNLFPEQSLQHLKINFSFGNSLRKESFHLFDILRDEIH